MENRRKIRSGFVCVSTDPVSFDGNFSFRGGNFILDNLQIRKMQKEDYEEAYQLWMACSGMGMNNLDDSQPGIENFLARNPETCHVAVISGKIVGTILVGSDGRRGYIYHAAVHPAWRRRGIAKRLVAQAVGSLEQIGIHKAALVAFKRNKEGNDFWDKLGFAVRDDLAYRDKTITEMIRIDT